MDLGAMAVCADWENVNGLNPLLHEPSEPSEPPVVKTSPERLTRALHPAPIEDAYHGAVFGNLGIGLRRADRRLRHRPFAPNRSGQNATAGGSGVPGVQDGCGPYSRKASCNTKAAF